MVPAPDSDETLRAPPLAPMRRWRVEERSADLSARFVLLVVQAAARIIREIGGGDGARAEARGDAIQRLVHTIRPIGRLGGLSSPIEQLELWRAAVELLRRDPCQPHRLIERYALEELHRRAVELLPIVSRRGQRGPPGDQLEVGVLHLQLNDARLHARLAQTARYP